MLLIAHRGESFDSVENSISSVNLAWERGVRAVEIDIRLTMDNQIVAIHDSHTGRVTPNKKRVDKTTLVELKELSLIDPNGNPLIKESIPTLFEILQSVPKDGRLIIEVKSDKRIVPFLVDILEESDLDDQQIEIICFDKHVLQLIKARLPQYKAYWLLDLDYYWPAWLLKKNPEKMARKVKKLGFDGVNVWAGKTLNKVFVEAFHKLNLGVYSWTTNEFEKAKELQKIGVDAITSDRASWLSSKLNLKQKIKIAVLGIHGLGNKPPKEKLEKWWRLAIQEGLNKAGESNLEFDFEMIYWADLLYDKPLKKNEIAEYKLIEDYQPSPDNLPIINHSTRLKIMSFIEQQVNKIFMNEDYSLNYTKLTDTIIKKYFYDFEVYFNKESAETSETVRDRIIRRVIDGISKYKNHKLMILGHSMGSIIAYDTLNNRLENRTVHTLCTIGSPLGLPIVLSKIALENNRNYNKSNRLKTPISVQNQWFNFSDPLDKVAFDYNLADDFSPNSYGVKPVDYLVFNDYVKDEEANPHKSYGYLRTSEFSRVLIDFVKKTALNTEDTAQKNLDKSRLIWSRR